MEYPNNRADAKAQGSKFYFTGKPCTRGHIAIREIKGTCMECRKEDWTRENEKRKGEPKSEAAKAAGKRYYEKNKSAVIARAQARPREAKQRYRNEHKRNNPELYRELTNARRKRHREATPPWVDAKEKLAIRGLYVDAMRLSKLTGELYVVDHIIPLHGETVCGLHTIKNLRVMTQEENLKKSNKLLE